MAFKELCHRSFHCHHLLSLTVHGCIRLYISLLWDNAPHRFLQALYLSPRLLAAPVWGQAVQKRTGTCTNFSANRCLQGGTTALLAQSVSWTIVHRALPTCTETPVGGHKDRVSTSDPSRSTLHATSNSFWGRRTPLMLFTSMIQSLLPSSRRDSSSTSQAP